MRILIIFSADMDLGGGSPARARLIAEGLKHHGAEIGIVSSGSAKFSAKMGISRWVQDGSKSWEDIISVATESFRPDILYGITEALADIVMKAAQKGKRKVVYDLHGFGVVEILEMGKGYGSRSKRIRDSLRWLSMVPKADSITVANPKLLPIVRCFNKKAVPIIGMTDVSLFSREGLSVQLGNDRSKIQVLYAGNYFKWQGLDLLFDSIKILLAHSDLFEFTILGSMGRKEYFQIKNAAAFPEDAVHFVPSVDYSKAADYYRGADVLVIPRPFMLSTYFAFPQKLVDSMAAGKTIVATNIAPHRWALKHPPCGILCPPTAKGLAEGLRAASDQQFGLKLAANARQKAAEQFCHIKQTEKIYALFRQLLDDR